MTQQIVALGEALEQAAQDDNWPQVTQIDKQINLLLQALRTQTLNESTQAQLQQLQQRHARVAEQCRARLDQLRHKLQMHQQQSQGRQAYSLFSDERGEM